MHILNFTNLQSSTHLCIFTLNIIKSIPKHSFTEQLLTAESDIEMDHNLSRLPLWGMYAFLQLFTDT